MSTTFDSWEAELYHHGILGQKWGRRRFQNEDGSLTEAGKARYGDISQMSDAEIKRAISRLNAERQLKEARRGGRGLRSAAKLAVKAATSYMDYKKQKAQEAAIERDKRRQHEEKLKELANRDKELSTREKEAESRVKEAEQKAKSQESMAKQAEEKTKQDQATVQLYKTSAKRKELKIGLKRAKTELSSGKKYKLIKKLVGDKDYKNSVEMLLGAKYDIKMTDARKSYYLDPNNLGSPILADIAREDNKPKEGKKSKNSDK